MNSDASMLTGEYFQNYQAPMFLSNGSLSGIELQYSSLQAYSTPVFTADVGDTAGSDPSDVTTITADIYVNGNSQGGSVTYDDIPSGSGFYYLVQLQAVNASSYATGLYPLVLSITKYMANSSVLNESWDDSMMVVNNSSSPYGAGWTIAGLQQITIGSSLRQSTH